MFRLLIITVFLILPTLQASACEEWFNSLKIKKDSECESNCRTVEVDMASYMCNHQCDVLCKNTPKKPSENYYGLTDDEIKFCKNNPVKCAKAYKQSWITEKLCLDIYPYSDMDDESDACRHYVWAILLSREIGTKDAETVLNAHENNSKEPKNQQSMDLANSRMAIINFQKDAKKFNSNDDIKKSFINEIKENKFIIIKPKYSKTGGTS